MTAVLAVFVSIVAVTEVITLVAATVEVGVVLVAELLADILV